MLKELWNFFVNSIGSCINLTKSFVLDETSGITLFHLFLFLIFARIIIFILEYMKKIEIVDEENKNEFKKEKRYKK